ncbi:MAG TPA: LCP family protein [Actinomycetota bacterium]|nr:LCP family protein [Actinomycetota bacterium]
MRKLTAALLGWLMVSSAVVSFVGGGASPSIAAAISAGRVHSRFQPERGKIFVLVIGNDARSGNPNSVRADAIHIVGIDTETLKGGILNFPRDSWVEIPGYGTHRINEALQYGGPRLLAQTLEKMTGIRLDYWVMTGFEGFQAIVKKIGGVRLRIPFHIYDPTGSGANLRKGMQPMGARKSLAYVRTRHSFPRGDIDRTGNQALYLLAMLRELRRQVDSSPAALLRWLAATSAHTRHDIPAPELFRLGVLASQVRPQSVRSVTVPVTTGAAGAASVVFISSSAQQIYRRFARTGRL